MVAEVCSLYVLRADGIAGTLRHGGPEPRFGPSRPAATRRRPRRHDRRDGAAVEPARGAEAPGLHLPARRPARRSTTPSSACRSCGPAARSACWSCRTRSARVYRDEESEALETVAMVVAEMIAAGGLEGLSRPGVALDLSRSVSFSGVAAVRRHRPWPGDPARAARRRDQPLQRGRGDRGRPARRRRSASCGSRSRTCWRGAISPARASTARCSRPIACSPTTAAGCGGWKRRCATA